MKKIKLLAIILVLAMLVQVMPVMTLGVSAAANDTIVIYPEYPEKIERDYMYRVFVSQGGEKYEIPVYNSMRHANHYVGSTGTNAEMDRRFCQFSANPSETNPVTIEIVANTDFTKYTIIPSIKKIASSANSNKITFNITESGQYVFRLNDDDYTNLAIFADAVETDVPNKNASNVVVFNEQNPAPNDIGTSNAGSTQYPSGTIFYIESGWHDVEFFAVGTNQQLYIAPGAVLNARVQVMKSQQNVKIFGRGMIRDFNDTRAYNGSTEGADRKFQYILTIGSSWNSTEKVKNVEVKDIILFDSKSFNLVLLGVDNCTVDGIKIVSNEISTDGISFWAGSSNTVIKNSFLYVCDNTFVIGAGGAIGKLTMDNLLVGSTIAIFFPQAVITGEHNYTNINVFRSGGKIYEPASGYSQSTADTGIVNIKNLCAIDCVPAKNSTNATGKFFATRNTNTTYTVRKTVNFENITLPESATSYKIHIGIKTETDGEVTELTTAGNYNINLKNVYAGTTALTNSNIDFVDYNNNRVITKDDSTTATIPASSVSVTNDGTFTPITKNDKTASYTSYKTYIRDTQYGLRIYPSTATFEQDGTIYVSAKSVAEQLGFKTYLDADDLTVTMYDEDLLIRVAAGADTALYNDTTKTISAKAIYSNGEVMVPYDFFKLIGCNASYNSSTKSVVIGNYDRVESLVINGDFENKYALESWTTSNFTPLTRSTESHTGNFAMRYNDATSFTTNTGYKAGYQYAKNIIAQQGPGVYRITFWAKCNDTDKTDADLADTATYNIAGDIVSWYPGANGSGTATKQALTKSWKQYTQDLVVGTSSSNHWNGNAVLYAIITVNGASDVSIDDFTFTKISDATTTSPTYTITGNSSLSYGTTGKSVTISAKDSNVQNLTFETTSDYITVGQTTITSSGYGNNKTYKATASVSVAYPSNYERTARIVAKDSSGTVVGNLVVTIPATTTDKHVVDFTTNLNVEKFYEKGETLDTTALKLTNVLYNDGTKGTITSGYTVEGADFSTLGKKTIAVTYDNKTVYYTTTVVEPENDDPSVSNAAELTALGASIRIASEELSAGLRFGAKLMKNDLYDTYYPTTDKAKKYEYDDSNNYQFGAVMVPTYLIAEGESVISMYYAGNKNVLEILGKNVYRQDEESVTFTGVLIGIPETVNGYTTTLQTAFYVRVRESVDDEWIYYFSTKLEDCYYTVASKAADQNYNYSNMPTPTEQQKAIIDALNDIIDFVEQDLWIDNKWW